MDVVFDENHVYVVTRGHESNHFADGTVFSVPNSSPGSPEQLIADTQVEPLQLAIDGTEIAWGTTESTSPPMHGYVRTAPLSGSPVKDLTTATRVADVYLTQDRVYFVDSHAGTVVRTRLSDGATTTLYANESSPASVLVDGVDVFWCTHDAVRKGSISAIAPPQSLRSGLANPVDLTADAQYLYVAVAGPSFTGNDCTQADGSILRMDRDGGQLLTLAAGQACPLRVATTGGKVYWTNAGTNDGVYHDDGAVMQVDDDASHLASVVTKQDVPVGIAVDTKSLFWTTKGVLEGQGAVYGMALP